MTVEELIEELKKFPADKEVYAIDFGRDNFYPIENLKMKVIATMLEGDVSFNKEVVICI